MIVKSDGSFAAQGRMVAGGPNISIIVHHAELGYRVAATPPHHRRGLPTTQHIASLLARVDGGKYSCRGLDTSVTFHHCPLNLNNGTHCIILYTHRTKPGLPSPSIYLEVKSFLFIYSTSTVLTAQCIIVFTCDYFLCFL